MGIIMPKRMYDISMTEYQFVQWHDEDQIDLFTYELKYIYDFEAAIDFIRQFSWEDNCVYYWRDLLQDMDDQAFSIYRMTDSEVEQRLAELLSHGMIKAFSIIPEENDGDDFEYAEELTVSEVSKVAAADKRAIRKPVVPKKLVAPPPKKEKTFKFMYEIWRPINNGEEVGSINNDIITLEAVGGGYKEKVCLADAQHVIGHWYRLEFPDPKGKGSKFNMIHDPKDGYEPYFVFKERSYSKLSKTQIDYEEMSE